MIRDALLVALVSSALAAAPTNCAEDWGNTVTLTSGETAVVCQTDTHVYDHSNAAVNTSGQNADLATWQAACCTAQATYLGAAAAAVANPATTSATITALLALVDATSPKQSLTAEEIGTYVGELPRYLTNNVCGDITACAGGHYISTAATATVDQSCSAHAASCSGGEWEQTAPDGTTNRVCTTCSSMPSCAGSTADPQTKWEKACGASNDAECADLTQCNVADGKVQTGAPNQTTNQVCGNLAVCDPATHYSTNEGALADNGTTDRTCGAKSTRLAAIVTEIGSDAAAGVASLMTSMTADANGVTQLLPADIVTYLGTQDCTVVVTLMTAITTANAALTGDAATAAAAHVGSIAANAGVTKCQNPSACGGSEYISTPHTLITNQSCTACGSAPSCDGDGTTHWAQACGASNAPACNAVTTCLVADGKYQTVAVSAGTNRVCGDLAVCDPATHYSTNEGALADNGTTDRTCGAKSTRIGEIVTQIGSDAAAGVASLMAAMTADANGITQLTAADIVTYLATQNCPVVVTLMTAIATANAALTGDAATAAAAHVGSIAANAGENKCQNPTACAGAHYISTPHTLIADQVCSACSADPTCSDAQYKVACAASADVQCVALDVCDDHEYMKATNDATTDRDCQNRCSNTQWGTNALASDCTDLLTCLNTDSKYIATAARSVISAVVGIDTSSMTTAHQTVIADIITALTAEVVAHQPQCSATQWISTNAAPLAERQCSDITACPTGETETTAPVAGVSNRVCTSPATTFVAALAIVASMIAALVM